MSKLKYYDGTEWKTVDGQITGDTLPIGSIIPYGSTTAPVNWLVCDGSAVSRTTYAELFAIIGTNYGAGDGSTTFNLPNYKGRVPVGYDSSDTDFDTIGETGGNKELQEHTHNLNDNSVVAYYSGLGTTGSGGTTLGRPADVGDIPTKSAGTGDSGNLQPYQVSCFIIKAFQSSGLIANVSNTQSNSQTDTYSCDYVNGKIVDSSSTDYIKFADGTCIVWGSYNTAITLSASSGDTIVCNLPITMKDTNYVVTISKKDGGNGFSYIADTVGTRGTTSFNISLWNNGGANSTVSGYYWQVTGKWK